MVFWHSIGNDRLWRFWVEKQDLDPPQAIEFRCRVNGDALGSLDSVRIDVYDGAN